MANPTATIDILINSAEAGKQIGKFIEKFSGAMADVSFGVAKMGGAIASTLAGYFSVQGAKDNLEKIRALSSMYSDVFDISQIEQFGNEFRLIGGNADEAYSAIEKIQGAIDTLRTEGKGTLFDLAKYMQLNVDESTNALDILRQIGENYEKYGSDMFFRQSLSKLGIASKDMMYYLSQSAEEREKNAFIAQQNLRADQEALDIMQRWRKVQGDITTSFYTLGSYLLKFSEPILRLVERFAGWFRDLPDWGKATVAALGLSAGALGVVFTILEGIGAMLADGGVIATGIGAIGVGIKAMLLLTAKWALIIAGIAASIYLIYKAGQWLGDKISNIGEWWAKGEDHKALSEAKERFKKSGWRPKASVFDIADMTDNIGDLGWSLKHNWVKGSRESEIQKNVLQGAVLNFNIQGVDTNNIPQMKRAILDLIRDQATGKKWGQ